MFGPSIYQNLIHSHPDFNIHSVSGINLFWSMTIRLLILLVLCITGTLSQVCASSQYFNGQRCSPCAANCICTSDQTCDSCLSGFTFNPTFTACIQCPNVASGLVRPCKECCSQVQGTKFLCASCTNLTGYTHLVGGQCIQMDGCNFLRADGVCVTCNSTGYYLNEGKCLACDPSCGTCQDSNYCNTCAAGYFNSTSGDRPLCSACSTGCTSCTSASSCASCAEGYYLSGSTCTPCNSNCLSCTSTTCSSCSAGYSPIGATCYACTDTSKGGSAGCRSCKTSSSILQCTNCTYSYLLQNNSCTACSSLFANSLVCTETKPLQCMNDFVANITARYHLVSGRCVSNIKNCKAMNAVDGTCSSCYFTTGLYYALNSSTGTCVQCVLSGCDMSTLVESQGCICQSCLPGYQFVNNICLPCSNLHCTSCPVSTSTCTACATAYGVYSSACARCLQSPCVNCDGDISKCVVCQDGYYLANSTCYTCQAACTKCSAHMKCTTCSAGYYLTSSGLCKLLPSHCYEVDSAGSCKLCEVGYYPIVGSCYSCSIDYYNSMLCRGVCPTYFSYSQSLQLSAIVLLVLLSLLL